MGRLVNKYIQDMVEYLAKEGARLAKNAATSKDAKNRTKNQLDAFGYMVFFNGEVKKKGYAYPTPQAEKGHRGWDAIGVPDGSGREWLDDFMQTWKPESKGFVLIVVNAAFYSVILEEGRGKVQSRFRIISQLKDDMETLQKKFKGATTTIKTIRP